MATNNSPTREQFMQGGVIKLDTCAVCLQEFDQDHPVIRIDIPTCQDVFGKPCLESWLENKNTCPTCRAVLFTTSPPPPPLRLDSINDAQLAMNFVDSLLAKMADHVNAHQDLQYYHVTNILNDVRDLHGIDHYVPRHDFIYALTGLMFGMFVTVKGFNGRYSDDTRYWVFHVGRTLGWPAHVTGDDSGDEREAANEDIEDEVEDDNSERA